jgi:hypothetical protein
MKTSRQTVFARFRTGNDRKIFSGILENRVTIRITERPVNIGS